MKTWPQVRLGEVLRPVSRPESVRTDATYRLLGAHWYALGLYVKDVAPGSSIQATKLYRVCEGDFVYNRLFAWKGAFAMASQEDEGCFVSNEFPCFQIVSERLDGRYLWRYFSRLPAWNEALGLSTGGTPTSRNRLKEENLLAMEIPLPPIDEQRRVVTRIQQLEAKIVAAQHIRATGPDGVALLSAEVGRSFKDLGRSAAVRQFREFEPHVTSGPRNWGSRVVPSGVRFYRAQDVGSNSQISDSNKAFIALPDSDQGRSAWLQPGDLMLVITGATVGRCALFTENAEPGYVNQHVAICRFSHPNLDPRFVLWGLRGPSGQEQLLGQRYGQGKPGLNLNNIRAIKLPIPDMAEQVRIVDYLDRVEARVNALDGLRDRTDTELSALLPAVLDRAFRGEL